MRVRQVPRRGGEAIRLASVPAAYRAANKRRIDELLKLCSDEFVRQLAERLEVAVILLEKRIPPPRDKRG